MFADNNKKGFISFILFVFIVSGFFLGTSQGGVESVVLPIKFPSFISDFFYYSYIFSLLFIIGFGLVGLSREKKIPRAFFALLLPSFLLFIWSVIAADWFLRFSLIFFATLTVPYVLARHSWDKKAEFSFGCLVFMVLSLNLIYSSININPAFRAYGIYNNPNLMALASTLSALAYLAVAEKSGRPKLLAIVIMMLSLALVIMSGSRASGGLVLILALYFAFNYFKYKLVIVVPAIVILFLLFYPTSEFTWDLRAFEFQGSTTDSGRSAIWERAIDCMTPYMYTGMGNSPALECVENSNVHNSYLRVMMFGGVVLAVIYFVVFFLSLLYAAITTPNVYLRIFFLTFPLLILGEDYIVAFGSPVFFLYLILISVFLRGIYRQSD